MASCQTENEAQTLLQSSIDITQKKDPTDEDLSIATSNLKAAADFGLNEAQYIYGLWLLLGKSRCVTKNESEAVRYFTLSAKSGNPKAQYSLGLCYLNGTGTTIDPKSALHYFELSSEKNHSQSLFKLGEMYRDSLGTEPDQIGNDRKSANCFKRAADSGLSCAQLEYAKCLRDGFGCRKNATESRKYFTLAAGQKNHDAEFNLGVIYLNEGDVKTALPFFERAAKGGNKQALLSLSKLYDQGIGVEKNSEISFKYLKSAAESGASDAEYFLSFCLSQGKYADQFENDESRLKMADLFLKSAADHGFVHAQLKIADNLKEKGDIENAKKYYWMAVQQNNPVAKFKLGVLLLENGKEGQGAVLLQSGADDHISEAQLLYAKYLLKKIQKKEDEEKFIYYLKAAADNNNKEAIELYIQCLENGFCVEKNLKEAQRYREKLNA